MEPIRTTPGVLGLALIRACAVDFSISVCERVISRRFIVVLKVFYFIFFYTVMAIPAFQGALPEITNPRFGGLPGLPALETPKPTGQVPDAMDLDLGLVNQPAHANPLGGSDESEKVINPWTLATKGSKQKYTFFKRKCRQTRLILPCICFLSCFVKNVVKI